MPKLHYQDPDLRDLSVGEPALHEAVSAAPTGARLKRLLGVGGMSAVFLAELDEPQKGGALAQGCPSRLAIKITKPTVMHDLSQEGIDPRKLADREAEVLGRIRASKPTTDVIVGLFGRGDVLLQRGGDVRQVPWLALELVDGGPDGTSLTERIRRAPEGCDPVRAHRLARRIAEGVGILHEEKVVHRDLKPDNILVAGPAGDETPKIADCGIARAEGAAYSIAAFTREYAAPEQWLSRTGRSNPLIGPWTDVHALAAVVWFIIAGEHWCRGPTDQAFLVRGERRPLRTGERLHPGFAAERDALDALDALLARAASPGLPEHLHEAAPAFGPRRALPRIASVAALTHELLPLLEDLEQRWRSRALREGLASTVIRTTALAEEPLTIEPLAEFIEVAPIPPGERAGARLLPRNIAFQPDGRALARFGDRLISLWDGGYLPIALALVDAPTLAATTHVLRVPFGGFALVGPAHLFFLRPSGVAAAALPARADGRPVGAIEAALGDAYAFGVVTADAGEGAPELWLMSPAGRWSEPLVLPGIQRVRAVVSSPYGYLAAGEAPARPKPRAGVVFATETGQPSVYTRGLHDKPPLDVTLASAERLIWAAAAGVVLALDRGNVAAEPMEATDAPVAMGLDPVSVPWLVTASAVLRRTTQGGAPTWRTHFERDVGAPRFVGVGFSPTGVRVVDERGGGIILRPRDVDQWRSAPRPAPP
jgi:eukaryotic-like serine/threonine-protein kinase